MMSNIQYNISDHNSNHPNDFTSEELNSQLNNFEQLLDMLENPLSHAISEQDLELLNEISMKLNFLPTLDSFHMDKKSQSKTNLNKKHHHHHHHSFQGLNEERSKTNYGDVKYHYTNGEIEDLEASNFDPDKKYLQESDRMFTPRNMDYRNELKTKGMSLEAEIKHGKLSEQSLDFNSE